MESAHSTSGSWTRPGPMRHHEGSFVTLRAMPPIARVLLPALLFALFALPAPARSQVPPAPARPAPGAPAPARPVSTASKSPAADAAAAAAAKSKPVRNPSFYTAEVPLNSQNEKKSGMVRGLIQVITRLTGDTKAA